VLSLHYHRIQFLTCVSNGDWEVIAKVFPSIRPDNMNVTRMMWMCDVDVTWMSYEGNDGREKISMSLISKLFRDLNISICHGGTQFFYFVYKMKSFCHPETTHVYGFLDMYFAWKAFFFTGREKSCAERIVQHPRVINGEKKCKNTINRWAEHVHF
jgi:hypothetical protein